MREKKDSQMHCDADVNNSSMKFMYGECVNCREKTFQANIDHCTKSNIVRYDEQVSSTTYMSKDRHKKNKKNKDS